MNEIYRPRSMSFILLLTFFCLFHTVAYSQSCSVDHEDQKPGYKRLTPQIPLDGETMEWRTSAIAYVPLQFHIICSTANSNNWYLDSDLIRGAIDTVNVAFAPANIQFCKQNVDIIYNDTFANLDYNSIYARYKTVYTDTDVIHVYIPERFGTLMVAGYSFQGGGSSSGGANGKYVYGGTGNAITIGGWILPYSIQDKWIFAHELGHYFGLRHPSDFTYNGFELCNGSNCDTVADYCCDTPPEYSNIYVDVNCQLIPSLNTDVDANGTLLHPDPFNIMSSSGYSQTCRQYFTAEQIARLRYFKTHYLNHLVCNGTTAVYTVHHESFSLNIFPNPAVSAQMLSISTPVTEQCSVVIEDVTGKVVSNVYNGQIAGKTELHIDLAPLAPGIYFVKLLHDNEIVYRKIIKE